MTQPDFTQFRALLVDVDRTLTNSRAEISTRTRQAVVQAQSRGWIVALSTGRGLAECLELFALFPATQIHVLCAGAQLAQGDGKIIWEERISSEIVQDLCQRALNTGADFGFTQGSQYFASPTKAERKRAKQIPLGEVLGLTDWSTPLLTIENTTDELSAYIHTIPGITVKDMISNSGVPYFDITVGEYTKAVGAARWAEAHGLSLAQIIAVGDGDNDTEIVTEAGWGVAMGNALPALKKRAKQVIGHCDEDGLAAFVEGLTLLK